jgi:DNA polymerase-4
MFGVHGEALYERCRGRDDTPVRLNGLPKSVGRSTTFDRDTDDMEFVEGMLYYLTERAANHLRSLRMRARCVHARLRYADFSTYACSKRLALSTDCDGEFFAVARSLLRRLHTRRMKVRLVGVGLSELSAALYQPDLFSWEQYFRKKHLYRAIDGIRDRHGFGALVAGPSIALMNSAPRGARGFLMNNPSLAR